MQLNKEEGERLRRKLGSWKMELVDSIRTSSGIGIIWNIRRFINLISLESKRNWMGGGVKSFRSETRFLLINVDGLLRIDRSRTI